MIHMEQLQSIFVVNTFKRLEKNERFGGYTLVSNRSVGVFPTIEETRRIVQNNEGDICETIYDYALIEELSFGLYPNVQIQELYKVKDITVNGEDGKPYYNSDLTYEKIELPKDFPMYGQSIG